MSDVNKTSAGRHEYASDVAISVGAESADGIAVTFQVRDRYGVNVTQPHVVRWWLSDTNVMALGTKVTSVAYTIGNVLQAISAEKHETGITNANGKLVVTMTIAGAATRYIRAVCGTGAVSVYGPVTWAA